jgi:peptidoglycan hydrolase CwlO-like protein
MDMQVRNVTRALVEANPKNLDEAIKIRQYRNKVVSREVDATLEATNTASQQMQQDSKQKIKERKAMIKEREERIKELKEKIKEREENTAQPKEASSKSHSPEKPKNEPKKQVQDNVLNKAPGRVE